MANAPSSCHMNFHETDLKAIAIATEFFIDKYPDPNGNLLKSQANDVRKRVLDRLADMDPKFVLKMHQIRAQQSDK